MNRLPEGTPGKALALLICALMLGALEFAVVGPLLQFYGDTAQRLQDRVDVAHRYENAVRGLSQLQAEGRALQDKTGAESLLLAGSSDAVAAANLQSTLKDLVEQEGGKIASAQTLPPETKGQFQRVGLRVSFSGDLAMLTTVLLGVETARPLLSVGSFELRGSGEGGGEEISIAMDVYGFRSQ